MNKNSFNPTSIQYSYNYFCKKVIKSEIYKYGLRSNLDLISSGWIDSNLTKKSIPILCLPWWDISYRCKVCDQVLEFLSNCQKWCSYCFVIYTGCRHCLTTNIIFGITDQSQCKKCKRVSFITIDMTNITNIKEYFEYFLGLDAHNHKQIAVYVNNVDKQEIYCFINKIDYIPLKPLIDLISYSQTTNLKNHEISSSDIPIIFTPFNNNENKCHYCNRIYYITYLFQQKYCKHCLYLYIKYTANNNMNNMDIVYINTKYTRLDFCTQNIQEWCSDCSEILHFNQIITNHKFNMNYYEKQNVRKVCKLCKKVIYQKISSNKVIEFRLCSDCYQISSGWKESTSTKPIPILYLPWWDAVGHCIICDQILKFESDSQKWCSHCIIIYNGCRYCLTTNIIFGITDQSQCRKCKRVSFITIDTGNIIEDFLISTKINTHNHNQIVNYYIDENSNPLEML
ncbi:hypothetical protein C1645_263312 [Glomus cerebriforme]|uniref:Uncharacterized protein n=1 Tax=Glomus cerebriforme TaxID=658196 RepID=A0A397SYU3_9GLOM|nr:hypothetical protein C1645_263312 [Glomus cerebriforme]